VSRNQQQPLNEYYNHHTNTSLTSSGEGGVSVLFLARWCENFFLVFCTLKLGGLGTRRAMSTCQLSTQTLSLRRNCTCRKRGRGLHRTSCFLVRTTQRTDHRRIKQRIALRWSAPETGSGHDLLLRSHSPSSGCIHGDPLFHTLMCKLFRGLKLSR
jgi:hypothetical protein